MAYIFIFLLLNILGQADCQTNVALGQVVTMSSQYVNPSVPPADPSNAVDGNTNGDWFVGGCASTRKQRNPWMLLDLGSMHTVTGMRIYNREDCCSDRLNDFSVSVGALVGSLTHVYFHPGVFPLVGDIHFDPAYEAQFIQISMTSKEYLTLCEWEVYGLIGPVDGDWTNWSNWSECSSTCGTGTTRRTRSCNNPAPTNGGANCTGEPMETMDCLVAECQVDGGWSAFGDWGPCSVSCGTGVRVRTRSCTSPAPSGGGAYCLGCSSETELCASDPCSVNSGWSAWSDWSACSSTCGSGTSSRSRSCTNPFPAYEGDDCVGTSTETRSCTSAECPVNGGWSEWSVWTECSTTCGPGVTSRTRSCTNPSPVNGGFDCSGESLEIMDCFIAGCPVNGNWAVWSAWTACSPTCGPGMALRSRSCTDPAPANDGNYCSGEPYETVDCSNIGCPVNGGWTEWSTWTTCSLTCGLGTTSKSRSCTNPVPANCGADCVGESVETMSCSNTACPVNGGWTEWGPWTDCSPTCGLGSRSKSRSCTNPTPANGGLNCIGETVETMDCFVAACPVNGGWAAWGSWTACSPTCGTGLTLRSRSCTSPEPANGANYCAGEPVETMECLNAGCPVNGGWTDWSVWSTCSKTCGAGLKTRSRSCTNPAPANGGRGCSGNSVDETSCYMGACPVTGGWSVFSQWSQCSVTCGTGTRTRTRTCNNPAPSGGGAYCVGCNTDTGICVKDACPGKCTPTEECKQVDCSSWGYKYQRCSLAGALEVKSVKEIKRYSSSRCRLLESFGTTGRYMWVNHGCRARFYVCYIVRYNVAKN